MWTSLPQLNMRLFLAINFDNQTKKNLQKAQQLLKAQGEGHFSRPDNFHLTLAFLGEKDEKELEKIKKVMDKVKMPKLTLTFSKLNCFKREDETWWIGIEDNKQLIDFQHELAHAIEKEGLYKPEKNFVPHITLARGMSTGKLSMDIGKFKFETNSFSLMRSQRTNGTLNYFQEYERKEDVKSLSFR